MESVQKLASNASARRIVFDKQDLGWSNPPRIRKVIFLTRLRRLQFAGLSSLWWKGVGNVVDMFAIHGINAVSLTNWIDEIVEVFQAHRACGCCRGRSTARRSCSSAQQIGGRCCQCAVHSHGDFVHVLQVPRVQHDIGVGLAQELGGVLQRRSWAIVILCLTGGLDAAVLRLRAVLAESKLAVPSLLRVNAVQESHDILHDVLVVDYGFLEADDFLQQHRVVNAKFVVASFKSMQLRLCRHELSADHVHLLRRQPHVLSIGLVGFARRRCLSSDVVECILVVHFEIGVFELPGLCRCQLVVTSKARTMVGWLARVGDYAKKHVKHTPGPYGDWPFSSLLCRTLWKSYLFN
jgi:hypothetical protein